MRISLLKPEKEHEIREAIKEIADLEEALIRIFELHATPLTYNDIKKLLLDKNINPKTLTKCLKKLLKQNVIQKIIVITHEDVIWCYALRTDASILASVPVWFLKEEGYNVLIGWANYDQKEPYDLSETEGDYLMIHIDKKGLYE